MNEQPISATILIDEDDVLEIAFHVVNELLGERSVNAEDTFSAAFRAGDIIRHRVASRQKATPTQA